MNPGERPAPETAAQRRAKAKARAHCAALGHLDRHTKALPSGRSWCTVCLCLVETPLRADGFT